ncbi:MAG: ABC transporter permease subunit [Syntrophomonadales bacterium]
MRNKVVGIILILCFALSLLGCGGEKGFITDLSMLQGGKTFAVPTGTIADQFVRERFPDAELTYYNTVLDCAIAVKEGKADAAAYDKPVLQNIAGKNEGVTVLPEVLVEDNYGFAVRLDDQEIKTAADRVIDELRVNGTYDEMMTRWFPERGAPAPMPDIELIGDNGTLRFGTAAVTEPMAFMDGNHQIVGFDIELAAYIAQELDMQLEVVNMDFGGLIPALVSGKVDMIGAGLSITEERAKQVLFTQSYYAGGIAALVRDDNQSATDSSSAQLGTVDDIRDKRIGVLLGTVHDTYANANYPDASLLQYKNITDLLIALKSDKVDAALINHELLRRLIRENPDLAMLGDVVYSVPIGMGFNKDNQALREQFNSFLQEIKTDGTYDDMVKRWMTDGSTEMPVIENSGNNGKLIVGIASDSGLPFMAVKDKKLIGFDAELDQRFAAYLGKELVFQDMEFGSLIAAVSTNKIDMISSSLMMTEERQKEIAFSDPYYDLGASFLTLKKNIAQGNSNKMSELDDIADKRVGVYVGTIFDAFIAERYPEAKIYRFEGTSDMILALKSNKIDAAMLDYTSAKVLLKNNPDIGIVTDDVFTKDLGIGFSKNNPELREKFNNFLKEIRADGTYDEVYERWMENDPEKAVMPKFDNPRTGEKLVAGVAVGDLPYVAVMNNEYVGFDIEIIQRFAAYEGYPLEIMTMEFGSLIAALASGKVDMIADGIAITEERAQTIDFSDKYLEFKTAVIAHKDNIAGQDAGENEAGKPESILQRVGNSFYNNIIVEDRYQLIIDGLKVTALISVLAVIFGTLLGALICYMRMAKNKFLQGFARVYISVLRGIPVLVLLMIVFYVVFASVNIEPVIAAVIAFAMNFGAYVSEMFRAAIESVDKGQREAGIAGGFTELQTFLYIIMPQAIRQVLPVYKGEFISMVKMTSVVGYIAVQDLTKASDIIRSRTFDAFFPLIMVAILYFLMAWLLGLVLDYLAIKTDPKRNRPVGGVSND